MRSVDAKLITSETNMKLRHISCLIKLSESVGLPLGVPTFLVSMLCAVRQLDAARLLDIPRTYNVL